MVLLRFLIRWLKENDDDISPISVAGVASNASWIPIVNGVIFFVSQATCVVTFEYFCADVILTAIFCFHISCCAGLAFFDAIKALVPMVSNDHLGT